jgi:hypothetical protein
MNASFNANCNDQILIQIFEHFTNHTYFTNQVDAIQFTVDQKMLSESRSIKNDEEEIVVSEVSSPFIQPNTF